MRKWLPLLTISLGTFMLLIDVTIVNVALPDMAVDLHSSFSSLQWVIDIYALALAALLLGIGSVADLLGRKPVYIGGLVLFAVSSLTAGLSQGTAMLIIARGVQGVGGAAMFATTIALLNTSYQGRDRGVAFGIWGAVTGAAAAAGPILGGLLTQGLSWRWIFFVNLPISVAAVVLSLRVLGTEVRRTDVRIDFPGIGTFTVAAGAVTFALTRASENGWGSAQTLGLFGLGAVSLIAFLVIESRRRQPMIELALLRRGRFSGVLVGAMLLAFSAFAYLTYTSLWLQSVRGMGPIDTGLALAPLAGTAFIVSGSIGRFMHNLSPRVGIGGGLALIGIGALLEAHLGAGSHWTALLPGLIVAGFGVGLASPVLASAALSAVPVQRGGMASGAMNTFRQLGYAIGIAGLGVICQTRIEDRLRSAGAFADPSAGARELIGGQSRILLAHTPASARPAVDYAIHAAFASGLNLTLLISGVAGLAGAAIVATFVRTPRSAEAAQAAPAPANAEVEVQSA
jgi:EmrB/QacA subfamily drug resistance transporter